VTDGLARLLVGAASALLAFGGVMHALAFPLADEAAASLPAFFAGSLRLLWLADSAVMLTLAMAFALSALRAGAASRLMIAVLSVIPLATAALVYVFLGAFFAGHLLAASGALALLGSLLGRSTFGVSTREKLA
jgi:hypothetical protein